MTFNRVFVNNGKVVIGGGGDYIKSIKQPDEFRNITTDINGMYYNLLYSADNRIALYIKLNNNDFTFSYKCQVDRKAAATNDHLYIIINDNLSYNYRLNHYKYLTVLKNTINGVEVFNNNKSTQLSANITYTFTVSKNKNSLKFYLDGINKFTFDENLSINEIYLCIPVYASSYDCSHNVIFGDIFFADECLVDGNFTVDNTKLFMHELGPETTLESNNELYGMK